MRNIDKVLETWHRMDDVYAKKGKGMTKLEFLSKLITKKALANLRCTVMNDFDESPQSIDKLNLLFNALESLSEKIAQAGKEEPDSLEEFIWKDTYEPVLIDLNEFVKGFMPIVKKVRESDAGELISNGIFRDRYILDSDEDRVIAEVVPYSSEQIIHFETEVDVVFWLNRYAKEINSCGSFRKAVYAFVLDSLAKKKSLYPITFVDSRISSRNFDGDSVVLSGTFKTLGGISFQCDTVVLECSIKNTLTTDRVVVYGQV